MSTYSTIRTITAYLAYLDNEEIEIEAEVRFYGYNDPGQYSGPPENCYPAEGEDNYEILSVNIEGNEIKETHLQYKEIIDVVEKASQALIDSGENFYDD